MGDLIMIHIMADLDQFHLGCVFMGHVNDLRRMQMSKKYFHILCSKTSPNMRGGSEVSSIVHGSHFLFGGDFKKVWNFWRTFPASWVVKIFSECWTLQFFRHSHLSRVVCVPHENTPLCNLFGKQMNKAYSLLTCWLVWCVRATSGYGLWRMVYQNKIAFNRSISVNM